MPTFGLRERKINTLHAFWRRVAEVGLLNSAVEATVDRISFDNHELAKQAKDIGSAAVFVSLVGCAVIWGLVLYDIFG